MACFPPVSHSSVSKWMEELRKSVTCYLTHGASIPILPDASQYSRLEDLITTAAKEVSDGAAAASSHLTVERLLVQKAKAESFPEELQALRKGIDLPANSRLLSLSPELDPASDLIRVGGRLRRAELDPDVLHPIVLDSDHPLYKLLIKNFDEQLLHPGPERVHGEMRRKYWLLKGRSAIKKHQTSCQDCQKWRAKPIIPKMADLPSACLHLLPATFLVNRS